MPTPTLPQTHTSTKQTHTLTYEVKHRTPDGYDLMTLALPALTFVVGYLLNYFIEKGKERKRLRRIKAYFFTLATTLETAMRRQAEAFRDAAQRVEAFVGNDYAIRLVSSLRTERIRAIPDMDLFALFVGPNDGIIQNTNNLNAISDCVDLVDSIKTRVVELNTDSFERLSSLRDMFNNTIEQFMNLGLDHIRVYSNYPTKPRANLSELLNFIESYIYKYKENHAESGTIPEIYNLYIKPIYDGTRGIQDDNETHEFLLLIKKMYNDYEVSLNYRHSLSREYNRNSMHLDSARSELIAAVNALR